MNAAAIVFDAVSLVRWQRRLRRARRYHEMTLGCVALGLLVLFSLSAGLVAHRLGIDPDMADLFARFDPPSSRHLLGTDDAGRDELVRLMLGGRMSLFIGLAATALSTAIGVPIGLSTGYFGGILDTLLMRMTDFVIALPLLPLLIVLSALDLTKLGLSSALVHSSETGVLRLVIIISLVEWTGLARIVRAATLSVTARDFVRAAWALGAGPMHVLTRHVLPNIAGPLIVTVALTVGRVILLEAVLSFLGLGIVPPTPSWGNMLTDAQELVTTAPALAIYPGLLVFLTVVSVNLIGDGLQRAVHPQDR